MRGISPHSKQISPAGYFHPLYAASLGEFGIPLELKRSGGWLLRRSITGSSMEDAMGCYPIFSCNDWAQLQTDLDTISSGLVSVTLVSDPFGNYDKDLLLSCFDRVVPFKQHYVVDLDLPFESYTSATHTKFARKAQNKMDIEVCTDPIAHLDDWCQLYGELVTRKSITGIRVFSRSAFEQQLAIPGTVLFRASEGEQTIALDWWYVQGEVAQGHLVAMNSRAYELHAGYALKLAIMQYFKGRLRWLNLGGIPDSDHGNKSGAGLAAFKRGWASEVRTAWLCGRICNQQAYTALCMKQQNAAGDYFPAYRQGEFA